MPKKGFSSITVNTHTYDSVHKIYEQNKDALAANGVGSFTGFCILMIARGVADWKPPKNLFEKE